VLFGCVWCSSPPQGSSVISRKRNLPPYAPATRRAWSPAARYGTGTKLCCVDVGAAPLRRHGTVVTVVVLERLLCHAQPSHAQPSPPVLLWSIIVVTSHPLRHGTVVTVVVLGTAVVSRAAVAVGVIVVDHWCGVIRIIEIMTPWSWRHARAWPLGAKGLWAYCPSYTARSTQQK
jgi:hypothetical protein